MKLRSLTLLLLTLAVSAFAQNTRTNRIYRPCSGSTTPASVAVSTVGAITMHPCAGKTVSIDGSTIPSITGGTASYFPYFTSSTNLGTSPFAWNSTTQEFSFDNSTHDSEWKLFFRPTGNSGSGTFLVGNTADQTAYIQATDAGEVNLLAQAAIQMTANSFVFDAAGSMSINSGSNINIGDVINAPYLQINVGTGTFTFENSNSTFNVKSKTWKLNKSVTSAGTTGNATINAPAGTVNFAAGTSSLTLTNNSILSNAIVFCVVRSNDSTAKSCAVTDIASGSATVRLNANATAETSVGFWVIN
jgi:hypothetical protein